MACEWSDKIFNVCESDFENLTLEVFRFQYRENEIYQQYVNALGKKADEIKTLNDIPFLPVSFFKTHQIQTTKFKPEIVFESSGTSNTGNSQHLVRDLNLYRESYCKAFELFYGSVTDYCVIGLLPSYLERSGSSLVYMVNDLILKSKHALSGTYLYEFEKLKSVLEELVASGQKAILIGVTFALLDFAEKFQLDLSKCIIMETGGMKGRRQEMIREEVHAVLKNSFNSNAIHSEYGMTELLSQAYSKGNGIFNCPPWMKIILRDEEDPLSIKKIGINSGVINIIDLTNIYSCSFIATEDVGKIFADNSFEVLGRMDGSDMRGCSLMIV